MDEEGGGKAEKTRKGSAFFFGSGFLFKDRNVPSLICPFRSPTHPFKRFDRTARFQPRSIRHVIPKSSPYTTTTSNHPANNLSRSFLGSLLEGDASLLAHGSDDGDSDLLTVVEGVLDVFTEGTLGDFDVVLGGTVGEHEVEEALRGGNSLGRREGISHSMGSRHSRRQC